MAVDRLGTWPEWLQLGAVLIALVALLASRRDVARNHASQVFVMVLQHNWTVHHDEVPRLELRAVVVNTDRTPITRVNIALFTPGRKRITWWTSNRQEHWWTGHRLVGRSYFTIAPQSSGEPFDYDTEVPRNRLGPQILSELPALLLTFTDNANRRWVRWPDGRIRRYRTYYRWRGRRRPARRVN